MQPLGQGTLERDAQALLPYLVQGLGLGIGARVTHNAAQSIATATLTTLAFNTERWDTGNCHDNVTNNSRLTCPRGGKYLIVAQATFAVNATGSRGVYIFLNGATYIGVQLQQAVTVGAEATAVNAVTVYDLVRSDYVECRVWQSSGGNLNVNSTGNYTPELMMMRVG